jgi:hypothetical protein
MRYYNILYMILIRSVSYYTIIIRDEWDLFAITDLKYLNQPPGN